MKKLQESIFTIVKSNHLCFLILFFALSLPLFAVNNLSISGIVNLSPDPNGTYVYQGVDANNHNLWKHSTNTYYVYWNNTYGNWEFDVDYTTYEGEDYIAYDESGIPFSSLPSASYPANVWAGVQANIRYMVIEDAGVLPVELTSFTLSISEGGVMLNWETATEVNNYGFEIQRLQNYKNEKLQDWEKVGFVEGHGNSNSPKIYSFTDKPNRGSEFTYRLKQIDIDGQYEYSPEVEVILDIPSEFSVKQNYPNPFNPTTKIEFALPANNNVKVKVYNALGKEVAKLLDEYRKAGAQHIEFDASNLASGIYFYQIISGKNSEIKKMILLR